MFKGFRTPKFVTKCKTDIKTLKVRLEAIKKKRNAVQKYLKSDVADLLKNSLDSNAYGRAEGVLVEQNMSACYALTDEFLDYIISQLSAMHNQSECPDECKEAVASLMYAAARVSDLPELRDLRNIFTEKYGNSLESFVNKELVERFKSKPPTKEMKVQLMHDIAKEFSIEWDSKALEQKLFTPPPADHGQPRHGSQCDSDDDVYKSQKKKHNALPNRKNQDAGEKLSYFADDKYKLPSSSDDETTDMSHDGRVTASSSVGSRSEDEEENKMPSANSKFAPPPYYKPKPQRKQSAYEERRETKGHADSVVEENAKPMSVRGRRLKPPPGRENQSDPVDEEERIMDGMLLHYSQKKSPYEDADESTRHRSRRSGKNVPAARASSVPPPEPSSSPEIPKRRGRASSLTSDAHVHPKLPEYDELAARIAAIRGT